LLAAFVAVGLHLGLMNFELTVKPVLVPNVSLPRSVSVLLYQANIAAPPLVEPEKLPKAQHLVEEQPAAVSELARPITQKVAVKEKKEISDRQPHLSAETFPKPAVEKSIPEVQSSFNLARDSMTEQDKPAQVTASVTGAEPQAVLGNAGTAQPGTLQVAYPRYQLNAPPAYPGLARKRGQEGTVILQVLVSKDGRVDDLKIETSSGFRLLDRAAAITVEKWLFEPGQRDGKKVEMWVKVPVTFKLK